MPDALRLLTRSWERRRCGVMVCGGGGGGDDAVDDDDVETVDWW